MMKLSPYAAEFRPSAHPVEPSADFCIFNDGVPSLVLPSESAISDLLHGIPDEALDERFFPSADEAAELDAVSDFVETMAILSFMEECEERARINFDHVQKRWESRRAEGLVGRPRPAKHLVESVPHGGVRLSTSKALVAHHQPIVHRSVLSEQQFLQRKEAELLPKHQDVSNRRNPVKPRHAIQQPRKLN